MNTWGPMLIGFVVSLIGLGCVFMVFLDYHRKSNIHKAILYVLCFFVLLFFFSKILLPFFSFYIALLIPVLLIIFLFLSKLFR